MRKTLIALVALTGVMASTGAAVAAPDVHRSVLQRDADALLDQGAPGALVELDTPDGRVKVRSGYGNTAARTPVSWQTHFRIGSATKTFTATVLLQLVGEGRLSLEDTVDRWLPGVVSGNGNDGTKITVRQLLQHTSGVPDYTQALDFLRSAESFQANRFRTLTPTEMVAIALRYPPTFAPGTGWEYSNTNYVLAGMIIQKITGHDWQWEVQRRIIGPLGLRDTTAPHTEPYLPTPHAVGYQSFSADGPVIDATVMNPTWGDAAGAIISDTDDLNTFFQALIGGRLLAPDQLRQMQTTVPAHELDPAYPNVRYGLGIMWVPTSCGGYWSHGGDIPGFKTRDGVSADGRRSVVITINNDALVPKQGTPPAKYDVSVDLMEHAFCGTS
ncbi:serine hydrolase domain-containing protein [Kutzneria sp. CA-103260]|uniref:serine hydrolase domain-containing protein n=1 Tax=Kutzneria sp. CA-103260 TaxID=2802641 RepID=UPI001BA83498|nr:serine hydrolase domain-containing protein [Kutzneria sp. CA-103260]QUQ67269.1 peptidase [Kutzneria sp. CA-103260]